MTKMCLTNVNSELVIMRFLKGRWINIAHNDWTCPFCITGDIGYELHYLFCCSQLKNEHYFYKLIFT